MDTANYGRVNPLPSSAISSSSSGELHLYIDSGTSSPSDPAGPHSSSQELPTLSQVPQPPPLATQTTASAQQPIQPTNIQSWVDEVTTAEQSGHSTPETVVPDWAYSGRIRGARPRSQPLVYPPQVMPKPSTQRPLIPSTPYGPALPPMRPEQSFPNHLPTIGIFQPKIIPALIPHPEGVREQRHTRSIPFAPHRYRLHNRLLDTQRAPIEAHSPHHPADGLVLSRQQTAFHTGHKNPILDSTYSAILLALISFRVYTCQRGLATPSLQPSTR